MECPRCQHPIESGAQFCGNCGQPLAGTTQPSPMFGTANQANAQTSHHGGVQSVISLTFGVLSIPAGVILPIAGLVFGVVGLILGTIARSLRKTMLPVFGIALCSIAILVSLASLAYAYEHNKKQTARNTSSDNNTAAVSTSNITTPCYVFSFAQQMNTDHDENDKCDVRAYEGADILSSNDVYKIYSNQISNLTEVNFNDVAKKAIEKDIADTLPGFEITSEGPTLFAESPAYVAHAYNKAENIAVVEAAVFHKVSAGYNVFSVVHAIKGSETDLSKLELQWQWK